MPSGILSRFFSFEQAVIARNSRILLSNTSPRRVIPRSYTMAASGSGSKAMFSDICFDDMITNCANGLDFSKHMGVFFSDRTRSSCLRASMKVKSRGFCDSRLVCQYSLIGSAQRKSDPSKVIVGPLMKNSHSASSLCFSVGPARDVSLEGDSRDGQSLDSTLVSGQVLKLLSGSCYLPHPDKEETGGEDAHFICDDNKVIGVADGVGGWAEVGINAGEYSRELMSKSVIAIQDEPRDCIDPSRVLEKAYSCTIAQGSSTACIIALTKEGVHAINLGDSGFMVIREGCTIFQSPVQQHSFNLTYQLECGSRSDLPSSGQVFKFPVAPGDVIIAGTDGLFDNLYNNEVTAVVVHSVRAGFGPETTAQKIAALARERAQDRNRQTPFSTAAQDAGYRYYGGKLDDITVIVSYITG